jgi:hypothetical protein
MNTLYETYKKVLNEAVALSEIIDAIDNTQVIRFYYEGDNTENKGWRSGEIYALGDSIAGNKVIRVYQLQGVTDSKTPQWKLFRVDSIRDIETVGSFNQARPLFNSQGDNSMATVYKIVNF